MEKLIAMQDGFKMILDDASQKIQQTSSLNDFRLTESSMTDSLSSNSLIEQSFGWLNNSTNIHSFSSADVRCCCPSCASGSNLFSTNGNKKTSSSDIAPQEATTTMSGDSQMDGILSGYKWGFSWGSRQLTYSFYENDVFAGSYYGSETAVTEVSEAVKTNVRSILNWLENVINVDFVEVTETSTNYGRLRVMRSESPGYAYAYYPYSDSLASSSGDVHLKTSYDRLGDTNGFQHPAGKHGYGTLIHEIGHAMGLKHPHDTSSLNSTLLPSAENKQTNTIMTYNFDGNEPGTYMRYDIKALQYLYGTKDYNTANTTYQFTNRIDLFSVNGQQSLNTPYSTKQLIWDSAGIDTLDFSGLSSNSAGYRFDLSSGGLMSVSSAYNSTSNTISYGTEIAYSVSLENLINSSSNDTVLLNNTANVISGYTTTKATGNDVIYNGTAQDSLQLDYDLAAVTQTQSSNDLILGLGTNGSITLKNYYLDATNRINVIYRDTIPTPVVPNLSINDITVGENGIATLSVSLSQATTEMVTVDYATADGTALNGQDYTSQTGTLTFNPGETSQSLIINLVNDSLYESTSEVFNVNLSNVLNGTLNKQQASVTILDDDKLLPNISVKDVRKNEGSSRTSGKTTSFAFTVSLSSASTEAVTVQYGTAQETAITGSDYIATQGTLTFNPGEISKIVNVKVYADVNQESDETFSFNLSNANKALISKSQALGTVVNDDLTQNNILANKNNSLSIEENQTRDFLTGTKNADTFILGDHEKAYYTEAGSQDFILIKNFNSNQGDVIQLHGNANLYELVSSSVGELKETGIFYNQNNTQELIGVVSTVESLSLQSQSFSFV